MTDVQLCCQSQVPRPLPPLLPLIVILIELSLCDSIQLSLRMSINYLCVTLIASRCGSDDCGHSVCVCERKRVWEGDRLCVCVWLFMPNGSKLNFNVCCAYTHTPSFSLPHSLPLSLTLLNMLASFIIYFNYILMPTNSLSVFLSLQVSAQCKICWVSCASWRPTWSAQICLIKKLLQLKMKILYVLLAGTALS